MSEPVQDWPFDQPRNSASFTLKSILRNDVPILLVTHDDDDGGWQFLDGQDIADRDAAIVGLGEIVKLDPTLLEIADLPEGWRAWRSARGAPWQRERKPTE